ncbi:MAG: hypothetical protein IPG04_09145 [Polyangiaceae bacterium]|nr:hypothetical protein [Polyangiaceae bacterium]
MEGSGLGLLRRNRLQLALGALPFAFFALLTVVAITTGYPGWMFLGGVFLLLGAAALTSAWQRNSKPVRSPEPIGVEPDGVRVGGRLEVPRDAIRAGFVVPYFGVRPRLRLIRRGLRPALELEADDLGVARAALERLGLDASHTVLQIDTPSFVAGRTWLAAVVALVAMVLSVKLGEGLATPALLLAIGAYAVLRFIPSHTEVGLDGVRVRWLAWRRLYRYEDLARVDAYHALNQRSSGLWLTDTTGKRHNLRINFKDQDPSKTTAVYERIAEAVAAYRRGYRGHAGGGLERGDRSPAEWVAALRRVGHGAGASHRSAPVDPERLLEVVEDASARPVLRAAAAVALGGVSDPRARERIRVAAAASVTPSVRVALERASHEDTTDDALLEALASVEAEEDGARRAAR